jgi:hypothetical protein
MLYELFLIIFGIYVGQEYPALPSVKIAVGNLVVYLGQEKNADESSQYFDEFLKNLKKGFKQS